MILLKSIPKVDKFVSHKAFYNYAKPLITKISKELIANLREEILENKIETFDENKLIEKVIEKYNDINKPSLKKVINATGIIVHTNLGISLLDKKTLESAINIATSYNNLEYNLELGKRGERYDHIVKTLQSLTGCEDALVVNNNASAVFLILNTFAKNKEAIVSRGELVEIGGSFRIPDVMRESGAILKEIGTTNKTHKQDYENGISSNSALMMKVHKSNYSIEGFSSEVTLDEMIEVAKKNNIIDYYDMGSGHIIDLPFNLSSSEPSILKIMQHDPSLISFSGDKLLGSVQAGIILGKKELIQKLKKNQLLRMLRVDKITLSILEESLRKYLTNTIDEIPTLNMLNTSIETLEKRAVELTNRLNNTCKCEIINSQTLIGGGTTPNKKIPTIALGISFKNYKPNKIEQLLRANNIIIRIENDRALLDFRTIQVDELEQIASIINEVSK